MKQRNWQLVRYFFWWLVFPFTVFPYMLIFCWVTLATYFSPVFLVHFCSQVASFSTIISDYSIELSLLTGLPSIATKTLLVKIVLHDLQTLILLITIIIVPLVHCIVSNVPFFLQNPEMKWFTSLPRNTVKQLLEFFKNAKYMTKTFTAVTNCENVRGSNMEHREVLEPKMLMLHMWRASLRKIAWKKNWKRAQIFWLTPWWTMGDTEFTTLPWILWIRKICCKN